MKEIDIKKILVRKLLKDSDEIIIGSEVPFRYGSRRADIMSIHDDVATAFEIKGSGDSVERLKYQVESYKEYFDYCYVVCEEDNLSQIRKNVGREIGLIIVTNNNVLVIRKSQHFKRQNKESLASTLSFKTLRDLSPNKSIRAKHELGQVLASNNTLEFIRKKSRSELAEKYKISTNLLRKEFNSAINSDDIITITRTPPKLLIRRP
ncbi:sce7726 family protein [Vibrio cholerae]|uniref:sce7726 family protein n=1 Tax=Vibrio TaxID=662 RepID=UPI0006D7D043|nr:MULTISPECIES: sce7726 family protein [Vibrio]EGR2426834.1 protein cII [Vibrio cholerae]EGR2507972.1 protein cII [Vibrio cholerae]EHB5528651.1 sce7726 family protein [Vibrio cholerae]EHU0384664.1 sce7726 family protein [Vibrio cholerae]EIF8948536.1 sce7726 family protein [Vibrio cholerae]